MGSHVDITSAWQETGTARGSTSALIHQVTWPYETLLSRHRASSDGGVSNADRTLPFLDCRSVSGDGYVHAVRQAGEYSDQLAAHQGGLPRRRRGGRSYGGERYRR